VPNYLGQRAGGNRPMVFGDYIDSPTSPLFPFGHGLSYTEWEYNDLAIVGSDTRSPIQIAVTLRNTGGRVGTEVVQLYGRDDVASTARPQRALLGFGRLSLEPGASQRITFTVDPSGLAFYNPEMRFVTEPGSFTFWVGRSSDDIRCEGMVTLGGEVVEYRQREIVGTVVKVG
jgi:beta-glucosidase